jgi:hypothetical protein
MLAQLEVNEINSRIFKEFYWFSKTSIQGLSRILKARGHPDYI